METKTIKDSTQMDFVINELRLNGFVRRNWCLKNYISRLGAIIGVLKKKGWSFKAGYLENGDYEYKVKETPEAKWSRENQPKINPKYARTDFKQTSML